MDIYDTLRAVGIVLFAVCVFLDFAAPPLLRWWIGRRT